MAFTLPLGVRFRPTKLQLVYFLATRLKKGALRSCYPQFIDCDVYSDHPFNILVSTKERRSAKDVDEGFFFSRLSKSTPDGKRFSRRIEGHGTWLEKSTTHQVCIGKNIVGEEKYFKFIPVDGSSNGNEDEWKMHEYYLVGNNEMVLCHITKKAGFTDDDRSRGLKRSRTTYAKIMPLVYEGSTSKRGRIEYDQPAGSCSSGIINPIQDYPSQVLPQANDNSTLEATKKAASIEEIEAMLFDCNDRDEDNTDNNQEVINEDAQVGQILEAAEQSSSLPSGALEGDDQFDIDEFIQGLILPDGAQDNPSNISLEGSWTEFDLDISSLPPFPAF